MSETSKSMPPRLLFVLLITVPNYIMGMLSIAKCRRLPGEVSLTHSAQFTNDKAKNAFMSVNITITIH